MVGVGKVNPFLVSLMWATLREIRGDAQTPLKTSLTMSE
jgi:hypothetical protein